MKFFIKDVDGKEYEVEEVEEPKKDSKDLSEEDIATLKKLASKAEKLFKLLEDADVDLDEVNEEDEDEKVIDTYRRFDSKKRAKYSFGAVEPKEQFKDELPIDDVDNAWNERFKNMKDK